MVNPLHLLNYRSRKVASRERARVAVPVGAPSTDALFLVLRRMRAPLLTVLVMFSIAVYGLTLMPGTGRKLTAFEAFYQMSITVTTTGFGEVPHPFSYEQRMWVVFSLYMLVICWAYLISVLVTSIRDPGVQAAWHKQRFRTRVRRMTEGFILIVGYGQAGRRIGFELDERRRRFVVIDNNSLKVERVTVDQLSADVPAVEADCRNPASLGLAGLGNRRCQGVLALTGSDEANLAVLMSASLLRPGLPVIARYHNRRYQASMEDFQPTALINPFDRYGGYLALTLHHPVMHQLLTWLMDNDEHALPRVREGLRDGKWVVCADDRFGQEVAGDLRRSDLEVELVEPDNLKPDLAGVVGFVAGSDNETVNIAMAEHAKLTNPSVFVSVRQQTSTNRALLQALGVDSIFDPTDVVAREALARIVTPVFWTFVEEAVQRDDEWAREVRDRVVRRSGRVTPERDVIEIVPRHAPAIVRWLAGGRELTIRDFLRDPDDREVPLPVSVLMLVRGDELLLAPDEDTPLQRDDKVLVVGKANGIGDLSMALFQESAVAYVVTGEQVPSTWVWRKLTRRRSAGATA